MIIVAKHIDVWVGEPPQKIKIMSDSSWEDTSAMADSLMEKELHRWDYMTYSQMRNRLSKITKREKLDCFIQVANSSDFSIIEDREKEQLLIAACDRWGRLFGEPHTLSPETRRVSSVNQRRAANRRRKLSNSTEVYDDGMPLGKSWEKPKRMKEKKKEKPFVPPIRVIR